MKNEIKVPRDYLVQLLKHIKQRPSMYIHPVNADSLMNFLCGFRCVVNDKSWWQIQEKRGWKKSSVGPVPQMRKKGMSEEEIMNELVDIEVESLEQIKERNDKN